MKYKLFSLFLGVLFMFGFVFISVADGYLMDTGRGRFYDTVTGTYQNADGSIKSNTSDGYTTQKTAVENAEILNDIVASGGSVSDMGPCTGETAIDKAAAENCAKKAQAQAIARGYTASCQVDTISMPGTGIEMVLGVKESYLPTCTINGSSGHGAYLLAGFEAPSGSNALVQHINPGWDTLNYELSVCGRTATCARAGSTGSTNALNITSTKTSAVNLNSNSLTGASAGNLNPLACSLNATCVVTLECWLHNTCSATGTGNIATNTTKTSTKNETPPACGLTATCATISFPATLKVIANLLNIKTYPNIESRTINQYQKDATFIAGNIVDGENVSGNNKWYVIIYGNMPAYVWSGGAMVVH